MSGIKLVSPTYEIVSVNRKTSAATMKDWRSGDVIRFSTVMKPVAGASGGGVYASTFTAENITQGTLVYKSQTNLSGFFGFGGDSTGDRWATFTLREVKEYREIPDEGKAIKYYEVSSPYYALIGAASETEAMEIYVEVVADDDDGSLQDEIEELERDYALVIFSRSRSEDNEMLPYVRLIEEFEGKGVLLIDGSLI